MTMTMKAFLYRYDSVNDAPQSLQLDVGACVEREGFTALGVKVVVSEVQFESTGDVDSDGNPVTVVSVPEQTASGYWVAVKPLNEPPYQGYEQENPGGRVSPRFADVQWSWEA